MVDTPHANLLRTPLHDRHHELGARFADFGGWDMPIEYAEGGVLREHTAVREAVGVFDVSHLGKLAVSGAGAAAHVNAVLSNDLGRITPGQAQYTLCCTEAGGVVDDLIAYLRGPEEVFLVPNAVGAAAVAGVVAAEAPSPIAVANRHTEFGTVAVQGPRSAELLGRLGLPAELAYMAFTDAVWEGTPVTVCRTGYTGEHGYELLPPWDGTPALWDALLAAGASLGALPCGLGARDTLRTEMGYPLHGNDLSTLITPVQARLGWAVGWKKPRFRGRDALEAERAAGAARLLWGLESTDRGIPRPHMAVSTADGTPVGTVTSGTFSPTRRVGIGLALLDRGVGEGDTVHVDVRGRPSMMRVVKPPFVPSRPN